MNQTMSSPETSTCWNIGFQSPLSRESAFRRLILIALAAAVAGLFLYFNAKLSVPVHPGTDQNGYLVGGKQILKTGSMAFRPRRVDTGEIDPYQFVGRMWVGFDLGTANERHYPKYPAGLPLVYAGALALGGKTHGVELAYLVSPVAMTLALLGTFLLARLVLGSIPGLVITILVAASPVTLMLVNNPNSHALTLFLVVWGMFLALLWWQRGRLGFALAAGLLIGAAATIRYSEGMLILPLGCIAIFRLWQTRFADKRSWVGAAALGAGWLIPVAALLVHNRLTMHAWTGYDPTHESTGFAWKYFIENWDTMLRLMYQTGFTLVFPMAVAGLAAGFVWNWRIATVLASWIVPSLLLYTAYYWAPEGLNIGYTRFFLTIFPALGICAFGLLLWPVDHAHTANHTNLPRLRAGAVLALTAITLISIPLGIANIRQSVAIDTAQRKNLQTRALAVAERIPAGSVLFCDDTSLANHLQAAGDYTLYTSEVFTRLSLDRLSERNPDEPNGLDPGRAKYLSTLLQNKTQQELEALRDGIVQSALEHGHRVFIFTPSAGSDPVGFLRGNIRRPAGWRMPADSRLELASCYSGTDPVVVPRPNTPNRFALGMRDRTPATQPAATWQILELTLKPASTPKQIPATRPAATRP